MAQKLAALDEPDAPPRKVRACSLDKPTQNLVKLIFDNDMFRDAMKSMEIGKHCVHLLQGPWEGGREERTGEGGKEGREEGEKEMIDVLIQ